MVAVSKACPQCRAETFPDDNFCQECGQLLFRANAATEPLERKALLTCLNCGAQHENTASFCLSCGSLMSEMGVYTTTVRAIAPATAMAAGSTPPVRQRLASGSMASGGSQGNVPHLVQKTLKRPRSGLSRQLGRPLLDLSAGVVLLAFCALLIWWLLDVERARASLAGKEGTLTAKIALAAGRLDEAISTIERLGAARRGRLSAAEQQLLNDALYRRAASFAEKQEYKLALADLLRVSQDFKGYDDVKRQIARYLARTQPEVDTALHTAAGHKGSSRASAQPAPGRQTGQRATEARTTVASTQRPPAEVSAGLAQPVDASEEPALANPPAPGSTSPGQWEYADDDVSRYNKLLADYFSAARQTARKAGKADLGPAGGHREPPTLKEWLESGKPDF